MRTKGKAALFVALGVIHLVVLLAGFLAPYDYARQNRSLTYAPPSHLYFRDAEGAFHLRPSACMQLARPDVDGTYEEDRRSCFPVYFFVRGVEYKLLGIVPSRTHLFGVPEPANFFLLGTDGYGRDVFSRLLYGGQISLCCGLLATSLSLGFAGMFGILAGYCGKWVDSLIMRFAEIFLSLPWLYLLFAVRAFLPLHISSTQAFLLIFAVVGLVGWARPACVIRGLVLSGKERHYIFAARQFGASNLYILRCHILPQTYSVLLTQAAILIPQYVIAEVTLSFLGLGVGEPTPSWGNMLATLQQYEVLVSYWWMWTPGMFLITVSLAYLLLAGAMQESAGCVA